MANGTEIHQWQYLAKKSQKWIFEHQGDGYYTIRSANSNGAYYLGVEGDSNTQNSNIVLRTGTITDGMKWSVSVTTSGAYRLTPKTGDWCLATNTSDQTNGVKLIAGEYVYNNSYRDEWLLHELRDYTLMYIGYNVGDPLMPPIVDTVSTNLEINANMDGYGYTSLTKEELLVHLSSSEIFSCITHGLQTTIATSDGYLYISDINSLGNSAFDHLKFVYFGACETGAGGSSETNLVNTVYNKGADAVLGFTINVYVSETNLWTKIFMIELSEGKTLSTAMNVADTEVRKDSSVKVPFYSTSSSYRYLEGSDQLIPCN